MSDPPERPRADEPRELSDLVGVRLTLALGIWFVLVLAAFFLVGVVVGMIILIAGVVGFGWALVVAIRRADTSA